MSRIVIINYGIGNLTSVANMLKKAEAEDVVISSDESELEEADKLILPGVGHFDFGMKRLKESNLIPILEQKVLVEKIPLLGICLGAQLLTRFSDEGETEGLGWVAGKTVFFDKTQLQKEHKLPHMGWNYVIPKKKLNLFDEMPKDSRFYFVHKYHLEMDNQEDVWLTTNYGYEFCAAYQKDNIYACQFHPEKSHKYGLRLLENFVSS